MADNVVVTAGTGTTVAADEVTDGTLGSCKVQYIKIMDGTIDGTTKAAVGAAGLKVDGSGATQPISAASLPLPTGAATLAKQPALGTAGSASSDVITIQGIASGTVVPISAASLPLPTGAATSAKQAALGTAGTPSTDVLSIQGVSGGTAQPISGTLKTTFGTATAFTKTNANLSASVTAGWKSNAIDNTTTRALDALVGVELAAVNTAPAGTKTLYVFAYGLIEGTAYTSTGDGTIDGTEGTVTFPSVTTLPVVCKLIGTIPYPVQNKAINGGPFSVAAAFGGTLPDKWGTAMVNDTGMTLSVTNIFYQEITNPLV